MQHIFPIITTEQYKCLTELAGGKEPNFKITRNEHIYGDLLSAFLKEYTDAGNTVSNANCDVEFYKLFERVTN